MKRIINCALLIWSFFAAAAIQAATVTYEGNIYTIGLADSGNVTTLNVLGTTYEDNVIRKTPWANSDATALLFMNAVGTALGTITRGPAGSEYEQGPLFVTYEAGLNAAVYRDGGAGTGISPLSRATTAQFAIVTGVTAVPIPAAAWLFGSALLGLGAIKRRKA